MSRRELSEIIKDLRASTLVGLTQENLVLDPLAVEHLDNRLVINGPFLPCQRIDLLQLLVPFGLVVRFCVLFHGSGFLHASTSSRCTGASCPGISKVNL